MLENYFENYAILGFYLLVSITVPIGMITLSKLAQFIKVRPSNPSELKESMYECGMKPETERWQGFNIKYYFYKPNNLPPLDFNLISFKSGLLTLIFNKKPLPFPDGHHLNPNSQQCNDL